MLAHNLYRFFEGLPPDDMEQKMEDLFYEYDADKQGTIDAEVTPLFPTSLFHQPESGVPWPRIVCSVVRVWG